MGSGRSRVLPLPAPGLATPEAFEPEPAPAERAVAFHREGTWRRLTGAAPRAWAVAVGAHDLFWSALAIVLPGKAVTALDRGLLLAASAIAFKIVHRVDARPPGAPGRSERPG